MRAAQMRLVDALEQIAREHPKDIAAVFCHSDPIKLAVAYYLGMPLDLFQRLQMQHLLGDRAAVGPAARRVW